MSVDKVEKMYMKWNRARARWLLVGVEMYGERGWCGGKRMVWGKEDGVGESEKISYASSKTVPLSIPPRLRWIQSGPVSEAE